MVLPAPFGLTSAATCPAGIASAHSRSAQLFEIHAATLTAARERGTQFGMAAERIDGLARDIQTAKGCGYQWVSSPYYLDLTLREPAVA